MTNAEITQEEIDLVMDANIAPCTVGLGSLIDGRAILKGSGTLVKTGAVSGILTCGHTLVGLHRSEPLIVGTFDVRMKSSRQFQLNPEITLKRAIMDYQPPVQRDGPDIGFIPIPEVDFSKFRVGATDIDLDRAQERLHGDQSQTPIFRVVAGIVGELFDDPVNAGDQTHYNVEGRMNVVQRSSTWVNSQWDLASYTPTRASSVLTPSDFKGTSGGGIWSVYQHPTTADLFPVLEGVVYWQDDPKDEWRDFVGHGPRSIYSELLPKIKAV